MIRAESLVGSAALEGTEIYGKDSGISARLEKKDVSAPSWMMVVGRLPQ